MTPRRNLRDDPFTFMIDAISSTGERKAAGGSDNVCAANAAFEELIKHRPGETLLLRQSGRIMREEKGTNEYREKFLGGRSMDIDPAPHHEGNDDAGDSRHNSRYDNPE